MTKDDYARLEISNDDWDDQETLGMTGMTRDDSEWLG